MRHHILAFVFVVMGSYAWAGNSHPAGQPSSRPSSETHSAPVHPALMTQFGNLSAAGTSWTVRVSANDRRIRISRHYPFGTSTDSWDGWRAKKGWFVFVENDNRVWAYDGKNLFLLVALGTKGTASYQTGSFPCRVPDEVTARISPAARQAIKNHS